MHTTKEKRDSFSFLYYSERQCGLLAKFAHPEPDTVAIYITHEKSSP